MTGCTNLDRAEAALQRRIAIANSKLRRQGLILRVPNNPATRARFGIGLFRLPKHDEGPAVLVQAGINLDALEQAMALPPASWVEALNV